MKKTALLLTLLAILSKVIGFTREIILSYYYGASNISDAYLISITIPMAVFSFIGAGISTGYIPMFIKIEKASGVSEANRYTNNVVNLLILISTLIVILGSIFTEPIVKIFASGFKGETLVLAIRFTKISLLGIYFSGMIYIFMGYLQLKGNYVIPALVGVPLNFFIILSIFLSSKGNIVILSVGSVIAGAFQLLFLLPWINKKGFRYKLRLEIKDKYIRNMIYIALPVIMGVSVNQINILIDRTLASQIAIGGISALNYANRLNYFIQGIFVLSISTAMYPIISKLAAENNIDGLKKSVADAIRGINLLVIPVTIGAMVFSNPIIKLLFGRGAFDSQAIIMTSDALFYYSIGMIGYGLREILSKAFYSLQDTKTPMINAVIALSMNIVLNVILSKFMGIGGLALATSISAIFCTILLFINLRKKIGSFGLRNIAISLIKVSIASVIMGVLARLVYRLLLDSMSSNLSLILSIGIGVMVYFILVYFMKVDEVKDILTIFKRKLKKSNVNNSEEIVNI
jgi:putative peptidoglycan lipid II flippase